MVIVPLSKCIFPVNKKNPVIAMIKCVHIFIKIPICLKFFQSMFDFTTV